MSDSEANTSLFPIELLGVKTNPAVSLPLLLSRGLEAVIKFCITFRGEGKVFPEYYYYLLLLLLLIINNNNINKPII